MTPHVDDPRQTTAFDTPLNLPKTPACSDRVATLQDIAKMQKAIDAIRDYVYSEGDSADAIDQKFNATVRKWASGVTKKAVEMMSEDA